jgi:uncharacterized protein YybS (DUF2232 family)
MHKQNFSTKALVDAGLISTIMVAVFLLTINLPMFSGLSLFILPVPVAVLCLRHDYSTAAGAVFVSAVLTMMLYNPIIALTSAIQYGGTGLILGYCIKKEKEVWLTIVMLAAAAAAGTIINTAVLITVIDHTSFPEFVNQLIKLYNDSMQQSIQLYKQAGVPASQLEQMQQLMKSFTADLFYQVLPACLAVSAFSFALLNYVAARAIMKRLRYEIKPLPPLSELYISNRVGTFVLLFAVAGALMNRYGAPGGKNVAGASMLMAVLVLMVEGVALAVYYLRIRFNMSKLMTAIIVIFTVTSPVFTYAYVIMGLADMIFDFRKLDPFRRKIAR